MKLGAVKLALIGAVVAVFGLDSPAFAATYSGLSMGQMQSILIGAGIDFEQLDSYAVRVAEGPILELGSCNEFGVCNDFRLWRGFNDVRPTLEAVNTWNLTRAIPEASVDEEGRLVFEMWVTAIGLTDELFLDSLNWFETAWSEDSAFWMPYVVDTGM